MKKLAIITTHPIQYYAPLFQLLHQRGNIIIKVFYTLGEPGENTSDPGFGRAITWDLPLLDGYPYQWVKNTSTHPGSHHFKGVINPEVIDNINDFQPDAVLVFGWAYRGHFKVLRYFKNRIPVYFRGDSTLLSKEGGIKGLLKTLFLKWIYSYVDHAFYVGQSNKAYFKKYGFKDTELTFAPHAIDNNRFSNNAGVHLLDLRKSLHISEHDIIILYAGKFEAVKNIDLLLSAFIKLNLPGTHLLLAGNGVQEKELKQKASPFKNVHFTDFKNQTEMPALYHAADIYCLPSYSESWGLSVNEAMACGKAILASNKVGCAADLVQQDQNGVVFGSGSLPDLCNKLGGLVNKGKPTLTEMGILSKKIIESWNFENIAIAIENKLLNEKI